MHNVLVGLDGTRRAEVAVRQALQLAEPLQARIHLVRPVEPTGPVELPNLSSMDDPLSVLDRRENMMRDEEEPPPEPDDDLSAAAVQLCEAARVVCSYRRLHGETGPILWEQALGMDMVVLPCYKSGGGISRAAAYLVSHPVTPILLCRDEVVAWRSLLLAYEPSAPGGRALRLAGELSAELNLSLDVVVADPQRERARKRLHDVQRTLRAFHVEGELMLREGRTEDVLETVALEQHPSVLVVPLSHRCLLPWTTTGTIRRALRFSSSLPLIVP